MWIRAVLTSCMIGLAATASAGQNDTDCTEDEIRGQVRGFLAVLRHVPGDGLLRLDGDRNEDGSLATTIDRSWGGIATRMNLVGIGVPRFMWMR